MDKTVEQVEQVELREVTEEEHDAISFYVDVFPDGLCLTQSKFYRLSDTAVIAVGELNYPNQYDDEDFDDTCSLIESSLQSTSDLRAKAEGLKAENKMLRDALAPFAAMGRVMETRARITFGKVPKDDEIVCESSGEAGMGILVMGNFRDAATLMPKAAGWSGVYRRLSRSPLTEWEQSQ